MPTDINTYIKFKAYAKSTKVGYIRPKFHFNYISEYFLFN